MKLTLKATWRDVTGYHRHPVPSTLSTPTTQQPNETLRSQITGRPGLMTAMGCEYVLGVR